MLEEHRDKGTRLPYHLNTRREKMRRRKFRAEKMRGLKMRVGSSGSGALAMVIVRGAVVLEPPRFMLVFRTRTLPTSVNWCEKFASVERVDQVAPTLVLIS